LPGRIAARKVFSAAHWADRTRCTARDFDGWALSFSPPRFAKYGFLFSGRYARDAQRRLHGDTTWRCIF
jgi:hypothetical protein